MVAAIYHACSRMLGSQAGQEPIALALQVPRFYLWSSAPSKETVIFQHKKKQLRAVPSLREHASLCPAPYGGKARPAAKSRPSLARASKSFRVRPCLWQFCSGDVAVAACGIIGIQCSMWVQGHLGFIGRLLQRLRHGTGGLWGQCLCTTRNELHPHGRKEAHSLESCLHVQGARQLHSLQSRGTCT